MRIINKIFDLFWSVFYFLWSFGGFIGAILSGMKHDILGIILSLLVPFYGFYITVQEIIHRFIK